MKKYLVLDYGGTAVKLAVMDKDANVYAEAEKPAPKESLEKMKETAREIAEEYKGQYSGVAVSLPGIIDIEKGVAHTASPYRIENDTPLASIYEEIYGVPVVIANDGKCAANAELAVGALKGVQSGVIVALGSGIAGGIIMNGKVWTGHRGSAGELSFYPNDFTKLINAARHPIDAGLPEFKEYDRECFSATYEYRASANGLMRLWCGKLKTEFDPDKYNGRAFFEAYDNGDKIAQAVLEDFVWEVAAGIFSLQVALDVERFAIGGGISVRPEIVEGIKRAYSAIAKTQPDLTSDLSEPEIVTCEFRNGANQIGALMYFLEKHPEA